MTDIQSAITRLRQADEQHPDFWGTIRDRDADPQMVMDVVAVARAYVRNQTLAHDALLAIKQLANRDYEDLEDFIWALSNIDIKAAEGLGE